jgi:hypothetical protein
MDRGPDAEGKRERRRRDYRRPLLDVVDTLNLHVRTHVSLTSTFFVLFCRLVLCFCTSCCQTALIVGPLIFSFSPLNVDDIEKYLKQNLTRFPQLGSGVCCTSGI